MALCLLMLPVSGTTMAAGGDDFILANEYIAITVNGSGENTGRFSVNTTGGDPLRQNDDDKPLIYGRANPWTSYTTVRVDQRDYVFGGPTNKRAGQGVPTGTWISGPELVDDSIVTTYVIAGIEVSQRLGFTRSLTTGLMDTARIEYELVNKDVVEHSVGLRVVLDTMLGANDGAPFRVREQSILTDTRFAGSEVPQFWQAFDSVSNPQVMAQGTLRGSDLTAPDEIYFTNWGSVADAPWQFQFQPGRDFVRIGEFELDSAMALFWNPVTLQPGQALRYATSYGMGGITIAPGRLSLGVTAPAQVVADPSSPEEFPIIAYIENSGEGEALDVTAILRLPEGFEVVSGSTLRRLGNIDTGSSAQVRWQVRARQPQVGTAQISVQVEAKNSETNRVYRNIEVLAPARLEVTVRSEEVSINDRTWAPGAFVVEARLTNTGGSVAHRVTASFQAPLGMALAKGESELKFAGDIGPGQTQRLRWRLIPTGVTGEAIPYSIRTTSRETGSRVVNGSVAIPPARSAVWWQWTEQENALEVGEVLVGHLRVVNLKDFAGGAGILRFDPTKLQVTGGRLGVAKGTLMRFGPDGRRQDSDWQQLLVDNQRGEIRFNVELEKTYPEASGDWLEIGFRTVGTGSSALEIHDLVLSASEQERILVRGRNPYQVE